MVKAEDLLAYPCRCHYAASFQNCLPAGFLYIRNPDTYVAPTACPYSNFMSATVLVIDPSERLDTIKALASA